MSLRLAGVFAADKSCVELELADSFSKQQQQEAQSNHRQGERKKSN